MCATPALSTAMSGTVESWLPKFFDTLAAEPKLHALPLLVALM